MSSPREDLVNLTTLLRYVKQHPGPASSGVAEPPLSTDCLCALVHSIIREFARGIPKTASETGSGAWPRSQLSRTRSDRPTANIVSAAAAGFGNTASSPKPSPPPCSGQPSAARTSDRPWATPPVSLLEITLCQPPETPHLRVASVDKRSRARSTLLLGRHSCFPKPRPHLTNSANFG